MLPPEAFRGEVPSTPVPSRFGTLGPPSATQTPQASTPAPARPRSLQQLMRLAETQNLTTAQSIAQLNREKGEIVDELSDLTRRLHRLGETGANEGLVQSVVSAIQERVAQQRKLEEEIKLLSSRSFSVATPRVDDTGRSRRSRAPSEQPAVPENEEEQRRRAQEALQQVQTLGTETVQQVEETGLKKANEVIHPVSPRISTRGDCNIG